MPGSPSQWGSLACYCSFKVNFPRKQRLPYRSDSAVLFESIRHLPWPVFIDSARPMIEQGRFDIITAAPYRTLITRGEITQIQTADGAVARSKKDPFAFCAAS